MMCDPREAEQESRVASGWDYRRGAFEGSFLGRFEKLLTNKPLNAYLM